MPAARSRFKLASLLVVLATAGLGRAQLQWDPGHTPATPSGGNGTWTAQASGVDWSNGTSDVPWDSQTAIFGGTAGTVNIDAVGVTATGLTFNTTGYTISGGTLTLTGTAPTVTVGAAATDAATISAPIAGAAGLTMAGPGTLTLAGANTYTGGTTINAGVVQVNAGSSLGSTTTPGAVVLGNAAGTLLTAAGLTLNTSATIASFNQTTQTATDTLVIASGQTLTVSGTFTVGQVVSNSATNQALTAGPGTAGSGGALVVNGAMTVGLNPGGGSKINATVDLQALSSVTVNAPATTLNIGNGTNIRGILTLASGTASTNLINVATINMGTSGGGNAQTGSQLNLGAGTNTVQANAINIGGGKSNAAFQFITGAPATASVTITGTGGTGTANITIGNETSGTATSSVSTLALAGHTATVQAGAVIVAQLAGSTGGTPTATATFDTGTFNATSIVLGSDSSGTSTGGVNGRFTLGTSAASTGVLTTTGNVTLVNVTSTQTVTKTDSATFTINGGTANIGGDIITNKVAAATGTTVSSTLVLAGGTLNMNGHQIGHVTTTNLPVTTVTMPIAGQTATLMNLGGTGINDAGVTMNGLGTLVLSGTNTFTGGVTLSSGQLNLNSATALGTGTFTIAGGSLGNSSGSAVTIANNNPQAWNADFAFAGPNDLNLGTGAVTMNAARIITVNAGNLTVGGVISDGGGAFTLTKAGTGTLTLGGANTYSGATTVSAGTLRLAPTLPYTYPSGFSVAGGQSPLAALNIVNPAGTSTLTVPTLALGVGGGSSALGFELATSTLPTAPLLTVSAPNGLTLNGATHTINVSDAVLPAPLGTFTLIAYNGTQITSGFTLGALPTPRTVANLDYATPGQIKLNIVGTDSLVWAGNLSADWDVGSAVNVGGTKNWKLASNGTPTNFVVGDVVTFNDTAVNFNVNVTTAVQPASVTVNNNAANTYTFSGPGSITGSTGLTKQGAGILILATDNTYTGGTTVSAGALQIGNGGTTGSITGDVVNNAVLAFSRSDNVAYAGNISGTGTLTKFGTNTLTLTGGYTLSGTVTIVGGTLDLASPASYTVASTISGAGGLAKDGAGVLTLTGANTYSGPTSVIGGTLSVASINSVSGGTASSNLGAPSAGNGAISLGGGSSTGTLQYTGPGETTDRGINLAGTSGGGTIDQSGTGLLRFLGGVTATPAGGKKLTLTGAGNGQIDGTIANGAGTTALVKSGAGSWTLNASNTYTGGTTLLGGSLVPGADNALGTGPLVVGDTTAASFTLDFGTFNQTVSALTVQTNSDAANVFIVAPGKTLTSTGNVTVGFVAATTTETDVTKLTMTGGGSFVVGSSGTPVTTFQLSPTQTAAGITPRPVQTVDLTGLGNFTAFANTFGVANTQGVTSTLTLSDTANLITAGTLNVGHANGGNSASTGTLTLGAGTNVINADAINLGLSKSNGTIKFASQTAGSPGTVTIANRAGTGAANISLGFHNGTNTGNTVQGTLDLRGHVATVRAGTLTIANNNTGTNNGGAVGTVSFDAGTFTVQTLNMAVKNGASTAASTGTLNVGGGSFTVNTGGSVSLASQATAGTSIGTINITGGTFTSNADFLVGAGTTTTTVTLNGGTLDMTGHQIGDATNLVTNVNLQAGTLQNVAQINGGGAVSKTTSATLVVNGTNTWTGPTSVSAGTLLVGGTAGNGATFAAPVSVDGTLGGHGTVSGPITINPTGTLSPGASTGILTATNTVAMTPGSTFFAEINGPTTPGTQYDQLNLAPTGSIDLGAATLSGTIGYSAQPGDSVTIVTGGPVLNQFASGTAFNFGGYTGTITYNPNSVVLSGFTPVPVPEPACVLAVCGVSAGAAAWRRRRARA